MQYVLPFSVCFLISAGSLISQTDTASLSGSVTDPSGALIVGAEVQALETETNVARLDRTNEDGLFLFPSLPPGHYRVSVNKAGFNEKVQANLVLHLGDAAALNFQLELHSRAEIVTVESSAASVNTVDASVSTLVERQVVANMPLNGRSFQGLITLTPGVATVAAGQNTPGQFVVNGQRSDTNSFTVDGVSANVAAPYLGSISANGTGSTPTTGATGGFNNMVSIDALEEFRIATSSFAPEYGRTPGAQVSLASRSGTNAFHGDVFDYFRNTVLDANDWFLNARGKPRSIVQQNDFGGVVGGPILKNRLFFFGSYEGLRLQAPSPAVKSVPTQAARNLAAAANTNGVVGYMAQFLNAYPLPDGNPSMPCTSATTCFASYTATYPSRSILDATSVRVDYRSSSRMSLFGRYSHAPSRLTSDTTVTKSSLLDGSDSYTAGLTYVISNNIDNDARFNFTHTTFVKAVNPIHFSGNFGTIFPTGFAQPPAGYTLPQMSIIVNTSIGNVDSFQLAPANASNGNDQRNFTDTLVISKGAHALKFGIDFRQLYPSYDQSNFNWNNTFALTTAVTPIGPNYCPGGTVPGVICGQATLSNIQHNVPQHFLFREFSSFAQDTWKATRRLTVTYGLRWEINPAVKWTNGYPGFSIKTSSFDLANMKGLALNPFGTPAYPTRFGNVAPRIGVAYRVSTNPKWESVLRVGYGLFYDTGTQAFGPVNTPWNARFNNQGGGATVAIVQFPITSANGNYVTPPVIPNPPAFPLALGTETLIDPNFNLPYAHQINATVEQQLGGPQTVQIGYVGAIGRSLVGALLFPPNKTNPAVLGNGIVGDTATIVGNYSTSNYHSLQVKFQRHFSHGLSALASYTWSHSIDDASVSSSLAVSTLPTAASLGSGIGSLLLRGSSDFDIRQIFGVSMVYNIPAPFSSSTFSRAILGHWSIDPIYHYQSASPVEIFTVTTANLAGAANLSQRPNLIAGVPIYVTGADCAAQNGGQGCPGGKALNIAPVTPAIAAAAGCVAPNATNAKGAFCTPLPVGSQAVSGNLGRNAVRAFPLQELDISLHREFPLHESTRLRFQADVFNVFNHPNFGPYGQPGAGLPAQPMTSASFGFATAMANSALGSVNGTGSGFNPIFNTGGPRNVQFALKLFF
ncbi:MAG: TonB-dependent receptor [Acidobacteriaceae bacterium]|nr:TonB-dependent receptor [Acidobacteriaceae bacterium]